ncbi:MAG: ferritin [Acidobacteria bacterium]|nr:MAG: ferritin [Acidobacteriota bacterium]
MATEGYHEPLELLSERTRNLHRAIVSVMEELDAIDWYQQRAEACSDPHLKDILTHNKNEEMEHAVMVLEWIRRHDDEFSERMKTYLFTELPITDIEKAATGDASPQAASATLGIGAMKGR